MNALDLKRQKGIVFSAVVAMDPNRLIGRDGGMPWHLPDDLKLFRKVTTGHPVVMGRKTWDSLGRALPNRQNIVLTRDTDWEAEGAVRIGAPEELLELELIDREICIIGGSQVYGLFMPLIDLLWVSRIHDEYRGDTWFPAFEEQFPYSRDILSYPGFTLRLYARDAAMLDSPFAARAGA